MRRITKLVAYYRLSNPTKGKDKTETIRDAYGLEVQRRAVARFATRCNAPIIAEFTEVISGTKDVADRKELGKAIAMASLHNAVVAVAKQDRLARNVHVISTLLESGIRFVSVDRPKRTRRQMLLRALKDEEEAVRIGKRTKRGMAIAKERGVKFGFANPITAAKAGDRRGFRKATAASGKARHERCLKVYGVLIDTIRQMKHEGMSLEAIAVKLNYMGHVTTASKPFQAMAVCRILKMFSHRSRCESRYSTSGQQFETTPLVNHQGRYRSHRLSDSTDSKRVIDSTLPDVADERLEVVAQ